MLLILDTRADARVLGTEPMATSFSRNASCISDSDVTR